MTGATFNPALINFEIEYELARGELEAVIADAVSALEFPSRGQAVARSKVEDLHTDVRDTIENGFEDNRWKMNRAWRALKQSLRETTGG